MKFTLSGILLVAAAISLWLVLGHGQPVPTVIVADDARLTRSYLEQAERWTYNESGQRSDVLKLGSGKQYTGDPRTYLTNLQLEGPDNNGRFWQVQAGAGLLKSKANELQLIQGVEVRESAGEGVLTTPRLRVLLDEDRVLNNAPVKLVFRDSVTTAKGMALDLKQSRVMLLSQVETIYEN